MALVRSEFMSPDELLEIRKDTHGEFLVVWDADLIITLIVALPATAFLTDGNDIQIIPNETMRLLDILNKESVTSGCAGAPLVTQGEQG